MGFVAQDFEPPDQFEHPQFDLKPLDARYNESDLAAWTTSVTHIRATPGWESAPWPPTDGWSSETNRRDLQRHAEDFDERVGFTYTVLTPGTAEVIGCVYIYPAEDDDHDAEVRSWVRADRAYLDPLLYREVSAWLTTQWPFKRPLYAQR